MMWGVDGFGFGGFGMGIGMILFWGLIIGAIVVLTRGFDARPHSSKPGLVPRTPLEILGERYARGEIDKSESAKKRRDLEESGTLPMDKRQPEFPKAGALEAS